MRVEATQARVMAVSARRLADVLEYAEQQMEVIGLPDWDQADVHVAYELILDITRGSGEEERLRQIPEFPSSFLLFAGTESADLHLDLDDGLCITVREPCVSESLKPGYLVAASGGAVLDAFHNVGR